MLTGQKKRKKITYRAVYRVPAQLKNIFIVSRTASHIIFGTVTA